VRSENEGSLEAAVGNLLRPADVHAKRAAVAGKPGRLFCGEQPVAHLVLCQSRPWQALQAEVRRRDERRNRAVDHGISLECATTGWR